MIFLLVLSYAGLAMIDLPRLFKHRRWWEFFICSGLMVLAFTMMVLMMMDIDVPRPARDTQYAVLWLFEKMNLSYN